ncbi:hypothetical protein KORDIASMS9_00818 [Kordia sp. SMS9]|uniref:hypothetical protein n=1 Tax=Kordia sp. SMS9 TaxID=2282170 RepID=UPI000E0D4C76|nr:hypothetical protein [Kordia sp. SMS9]AXG68603.1 hypothetical protein KORDIASMS9_00818 [Kordia sp. SMS9]
MKKRNLNSLRLNKKSVAKLHVFGGKPPASYNCGADPAGPGDEPHEWFTDAAERACETFDGTGCF